MSAAVDRRLRTIAVLAELRDMRARLYAAGQHDEGLITERAFVHIVSLEGELPPVEVEHLGTVALDPPEDPA